MSLTHNLPISFIATQQPEAAREFYEKTLGLTFITDNDFAIVFRTGPDPGNMLRVVRARDFTAAKYTVFGWVVTNLEASIDDLQAKGVEFLRYGYFEQDKRGIWGAPDGSRIAWFHDPDSNTLSLSQHPA